MTRRVKADRKVAGFLAALFLAFTGTGVAGDVETVHVIRAYDGDSLWLSDGREVRLIGVNTPELGRNGAPDQPLAIAARDRVNELVRGRYVQIEYDREHVDRYGRTLAYVTLSDGRDLQALLIGEGLGWFIVVSPNAARLDAYRAAESTARAAHLGIWAEAVYRPVSADRLNPTLTGFRLITGTIQKAIEHESWLVMYLTPGVTLTMSRGRDTPSIRRLTGKRIRARGWLYTYKGGMRMRISDPAMLEISS